ncbi:hypothetical protein [Amycolatopsis sp. NPDC059021]|uniref:hypothetical protein n=1 Tax=Amycolatopsis sp. NPDC059021 TaxID=3346704 RepID=UPI003670D210
MKTAAAVLAACLLGLAAGCTNQPSEPSPTSAPAQTPPSAPADQPANTGTALRDAFTAASKSAPWASKVSGIKLDGRGVIVTSALTKADKATSKSICEAALKVAKDTKTDFQSVAVRSADDSTLAHQNEAYGPKRCEN